MNTNDEWFYYQDAYSEKAKQMAIEFHKWMIKNDTIGNVEQYFHFSDEDMFNEYIKFKISK